MWKVVNKWFIGKLQNFIFNVLVLQKESDQLNSGMKTSEEICKTCRQFLGKVLLLQKNKEIIRSNFL